MSYKFLLGIIIIIICLIVSLILSNKYVEVYRFYYDFYNFNNNAKKKIMYNKTTINLIIRENNNNKIATYIEDIFNNNFNSQKLSYLSKEEIDFLITYTNTIGKNDITEEVKFLDNVNIELNNKKNDSLEKLKKIRPLYIKFGVLIGLIIFIIIM